MEQYKVAPLKVSSSELDRINSRLEELIEDCFPIEEQARQELLHQKVLYTYPRLDTSFLSLSTEREWEYESENESFGRKKKTSIRVPRFSVHRLDQPNMIMRFGLVSCIEVNWSSPGYRADIISPKNLPEVLGIPLLKTVEFFNGEESVKGEHIFIETSIFNPKELKKVLKKYDDIGHQIQIQRSFSGLIPAENKRTIKEAQRVFGKEIFLIAEARPEDWNASRYIEDPIVAGVMGEHCFYIESFNMTPLEEYVKTGFSQTKNWFFSN